MIRKIFILSISIVLSAYLIVISTNKENELAASAEIPGIDETLKNYCIQTLAKEVSTDYEDEMLKVQAIIVRTTIYKELKNLEQDLSVEEWNLNKSWLLRLENAWAETEGQVVMFEDELALVPFHQISNGKTRNGKEVLETENYPYLQIIECPEDVSAEKQVANMFIDETDVFIEEWDGAGYVLKVTVGDETMSGEAFREKYGLPSSCFEVQTFENQTRVLTKGVGHGLGLSQYSANEMAKNGKNCEEILQLFFPGTEIREVAEILWDIE